MRGGLIGLAFLALIFIIAISFMPVIFGSAEQELNLTENSTNYNETQAVNRIVLVGIEVSPLVLVIIGMGAVILIAVAFLAMIR